MLRVSESLEGMVVKVQNVMFEYIDSLKAGVIELAVLGRRIRQAANVWKCQGDVPYFCAVFGWCHRMTPVN